MFITYFATVRGCSHVLVFFICRDTLYETQTSLYSWPSKSSKVNFSYTTLANKYLNEKGFWTFS